MKNSNKVNGSPISQNGRFVNPFSENFFEGSKAVRCQFFSEIFFGKSRSTNRGKCQDVFQDFFFGAELRSKVAMLKAELNVAEYRTFVYPRTIKGASTAEFIRTKREYDKLRAEVKEMGRIADEIEATMYEAHLDEFVNTFFASSNSISDLFFRVVGSKCFRTSEAFLTFGSEGNIFARFDFVLFSLHRRR